MDMNEERNTENSGTADTYSRGTATQGGQGGACGQDLLSCIPMPGRMCAVLRRLRAPALSLTYRLDECLIPDLDAAGAGAGSQADPSQSQEGSQADPSQSQEGNAQTTACRMYKEGNLTVRLFDLGLAVALMTAAGCMIKCWCGCARGMKTMCRRMF